MLVVAIANTDRVRDHSTPSQQEIEIARNPTHGGADNFLRFIRDELAPWVDGNYRTIAHRVLIGHSSGGSFAIHALITDPTVFSTRTVPTWTGMISGSSPMTKPFSGKRGTLPRGSI
jgi:hypothetical protein